MVMVFVMLWLIVLIWTFCGLTCLFSIDNARAESMGNGNYLIAYTVKDNQGGNNSDDIYYRVFDSELGSFTGGSKHLGTLDYVDSLDLSRQEDGRVLIQDWNYFFAEVTDDGNGIIGDSAEELVTLSFDLGGFGI